MCVNLDLRSSGSYKSFSHVRLGLLANFSQKWLGGISPEWQNLRKIFKSELMGTHRLDDVSQDLQDEEVADVLQRRRSNRRLT
jgi:hypothetical protein